MIVITEKTIEEEWNNKEFFNDNYSYIAPASLKYLPAVKASPFMEPASMGMAPPAVEAMVTSKPAALKA